MPMDYKENFGKEEQWGGPCPIKYKTYHKAAEITYINTEIEDDIHGTK